MRNDGFNKKKLFSNLKQLKYNLQIVKPTKIFARFNRSTIWNIPVYMRLPIMPMSKSF